MMLALVIIDDILYYLFWASIFAGASWAIGEALKKKPKIPDAEPNDLEAPTIKEGGTYGVIFGMPKRIANDNLVWWGDTKVEPVWDYHTYNKYGNNKREWYVKGYKYFMGMVRRYGHGPVDGAKQVWFGDKIIWPNSADRNQVNADGANYAFINLPNLMGGLGEHEGAIDGGGIVGRIDFEYGELTQTLNDYISSKVGSDRTAARGLLTVVFRQIYFGTSPYPRNFAIMWKRTNIKDDGSVQWYLAKANINNDLNAAHMLRESYTCPRWGRGYSESLFDDADWQPFADTLYNEGFGLSYHWVSEMESVEDLIEEIKRHIDGTVYQDPETGKFVPKLLRYDYTPASLDVYDEQDLTVVKFDQDSYGEIPDKVYVRIVDVFQNDTPTLPAEDPSIRHFQGGKSISVKMDFLMITKTALGGKVAARELNKITSLTSKMKLRCKRTMRGLRKFDVFKLSYPPLGIVELIVRVMDIDFGTLEDGYIMMDVAADVFGLKDAIYSTPPASGWTEPVSAPAAAPYRLLIEAPFMEIAENMGVAEADAFDNDAGFLMVCAAAPSNDALDYVLLVRDGLTASFERQETGGLFTPTATIDDALPLNAADAVIDLSNYDYPDSIVVGSYAQIDSELVKVKAVNYDVENDTLSITIARGVLDTVPASHSANARIWFVDTIHHFVLNEYTATDQPGTKVLPRTKLGTLAEGSAPIDNATAFNSRANRPYPPGNFKINSVSYPKAFSGEPTITWSHRDRLQQIEDITEHSDAGIGPEAGTTYTLKIYDAGNTLRHTESGLTGITYTYPEATEISECGSVQIRLRFVLYAVRGGYDSWQSYDVTVPRKVSPTAASAVAGKVDPTVVIT